MSTMTFSTSPDLGDATAWVAKLRTKCGPLATVFAIHALLFYLIYSGMLTRIVDAAMPL